MCTILSSIEITNYISHINILNQMGTYEVYLAWNIANNEEYNLVVASFISIQYKLFRSFVVQFNLVSALLPAFKCVVLLT